MNDNLKKEDLSLFLQKIQCLLPGETAGKLYDQLQSIINDKITWGSLNNDDIDLLNSLKKQKFAKEGREKERNVIIRILENNKKSDVVKESQAMTCSSLLKELYSSNDDKNVSQLSKQLNDEFYEDIRVLLKEKREYLDNYRKIEKDLQKRLNSNYYNFLQRPYYIKYGCLFMQGGSSKEGVYLLESIKKQEFAKREKEKNLIIEILKMKEGCSKKSGLVKKIEKKESVRLLKDPDSSNIAPLNKFHDNFFAQYKFFRKFTHIFISAGIIVWFTKDKMIEYGILESKEAKVTMCALQTFLGLGVVVSCYYCDYYINSVYKNLCDKNYKHDKEIENLKEKVQTLEEIACINR